MSTYQDRLTRYVVMAAVPAAASAGYTIADFIHYGGPAIEITRSLVHTSDSHEVHRSFYHGSRSALYGGFYSTAPDAPLVGSNFGFHAQNTEHARNLGSSNKQGAKMGMFNNTSDASFAIATSGFGKAARFSVSSSISFGEGSAYKAGGPVKLAKTFDSLWVHHTSGSEQESWGASGSKGAWALDGEDEQRGYLGFGVDSEDGVGYGWMDIGWDGTTLTIYDWAFNEDGGIHVADTSAVPGGAGLAALAMGAAGLRRRRKKSA